MRTVRDGARDALLYLDELDQQVAAGLWMEIVHGGDTGVTADWREAYAEARRISRPTESGG
jgi:hypothetical protein